MGQLGQLGQLLPREGLSGAWGWEPDAVTGMGSRGTGWTGVLVWFWGIALRFEHPVGTWSGVRGVDTSRDGLSRQDRRDP